MPEPDDLTPLLDQIRELREEEDKVRERAAEMVDDAHAESVRAWATAQDRGVSYERIAEAVGVTKAYIRREVLDHRKDPADARA